MDADLWKMIALGIIEGLTEFLPISSTGHLLLWNSLVGPPVSREFGSNSVVFIQIGAIAAVVVYFRRRLAQLLLDQPDEHGKRLLPRQRRNLLTLILLACLPLVIAFIAEKLSEDYLSGPLVIGVVLAVGGVAMLLIENFKPKPTTDLMEQMTIKQALIIGFAQVLAAVFPGTSRSGATIMAGLLCGVSRVAAAEFSFFLAIPAMSGACLYKLIKMLSQGGISGLREVLLLAIGTMVSFLVAWLVIAVLMQFIRKYSFKPFGWYRIGFGLLVIAAAMAGILNDEFA